MNRRALLLGLFIVFLVGFSSAEPSSSLSEVKAPLAPVFAQATEQSEQVTQLLLGDKVKVQSIKGEWARVWVTEQYRSPQGYPGWVRVEHLHRGGLPAEGPFVTVAFPVVNLRVTPSVSSEVAKRVYLATRLLKISESRGTDGEQWIQVEVPSHSTPYWVRSSQVVEETPVRLHDGEVIVDRARLFEGTPYLWGGMTQKGIDCSGLVYTVYRVHGITVPRDADQQFLVGEAVPDEELKPGDMVFFGKAGDITHVGLYAGSGTFVHASSGRGVLTSPLFQGWYLEHYQGARRVLTQDLSGPRRLVPEH